jgi:putative acetyltransferase
LPPVNSGLEYSGRKLNLSVCALLILRQDQNKYHNMAITIVPYNPTYLPAFIALNLEWIEKYFKIEPHDIEQLEGAQEHILDTGGTILFALDAQNVIGCVALIKESDTVYELAKMAVSPSHQGKGIGELLGRAVIEEARKTSCKLLYLVSNQSLAPALGLYAKLGFAEVPVVGGLYERGNYRAELWF